MPDLHRMIYVSRAVGAAGVNLMSVAEIIGVSERNNRREGLTGLLLAHDGWFLQVVEGARADLERLMRRLNGDTRHEAIRLIADAPTQQRRFANWAMSQAQITPAVSRHLKDVELNTLSADQALTLLEAAKPN